MAIYKFECTSVTGVKSIMKVIAADAITAESWIAAWVARWPDEVSAWVKARPHLKIVSTKLIS
jgi:hypothetical protein